MVQSVLMYKQLVGARYQWRGHLLRRGDVGALHLLARVLERRGHEPAVLVLEHLVDAHLMAFAAVLEAAVIDQVRAPVLGGDDGVVALSPLTVGGNHVAPLTVGTEDVHAACVGIGAEVQRVVLEDGILAHRIDVGPVGLP